ncbi:hypothetical protein GCM10029963_05690 [Micromonospora andamanensis]
MVRELLRSWWHEPRPAGPPRGRRDWLLVALFAATALLEGLVRSDLPAPTLVPVLIESASHRCCSGDGPGRC